jgi:hypothetical protein
MRRLAAAALVFAARGASADSDCRAVNVDFTPSDKLQIVAWVETADGQYVGTAFITQSTGTYGIGNRPGVMGTRSGPMWPYGQRLDVFPVWAHRHGVTFPLVINQWGGDGDPGSDARDPDRNIVSPFAMSSLDPHFCSPMQPTNPNWDATTCASPTYTDKGKLSSTRTSVYPPRTDVQRTVGDSVDVEEYPQLNPFDAVSHATPVGGTPYSIAWPLPASLANGDYQLLVEVSRELDFNASYTESTYPPPDMPFSDWGKPYRGQPSVVYAVPFTVGATASTGSTMAYAGYSDLDGNLHAPDSTITTDTPGSGASRLELVADAAGMYRVRVTAIPEGDSIAPAAPAQLAPLSVSGMTAQFSFVAPGDDGTAGTVSGYDIRDVLGETLDDASFAGATRAPVSVTPVAAGATQTFSLDLAPGQTYTVGVRAFDNCGHTGPLATVRLTTPSPEVAACGGCASGPASSGGVLLGLATFLGLRRRRR